MPSRSEAGTALTLNLLSGGAALGVVRALEPQFMRDNGVTVRGRFGAVGAMKEALLAGEPCDVFITTAAMLAELAGAGMVRKESCRAIGSVATGIAVRAGEPSVDVATPDALRRTLEGAGEIHFPDPQRATAGIHFMRVLAALGIAQALAPRLRTHPNGATAMRALAGRAPAGAVGCTQVSEILATAGVQHVAALPAPHGLVTVYSAGVTRAAADAALGARFVECLTAPSSRALRHRAGFEDPT